LLIIKSQPLLGTGEAGRPSKGGVLKAGSIVGRFAMAWKWAAGRCGAVAHMGRWQCSTELREEERVSLLGRPIGPHGLHRGTGRLGPMPGKEFLWI
jgi:hypothetical protein